jgi:hypothetical protein
MAALEERSRLMRTVDPKVSMRLRLAGALAVPRSLPVGTRHRVVKSVRSHFMVEWIHENWEPAVVVCRRHPLDVVASRLEMPYRLRPGGVDQVVRDEARTASDVIAQFPIAARDDLEVSKSA